MMIDRTMQATPKRILLKELIGQCAPMNEREWAAAEEIVRLQDQNAGLLEALKGLLAEYEDQLAQFGEDPLWQKHSNTEAVEAARIATIELGGEE